MPIWGQVELLCRSISEAGRMEAEALLEQARLQADKIIRDAGHQAGRQFEDARLSGKSQAVAEARQIVDTAELEAKRRVMSFHQEMLQEVLDALKDRLKRFRTEPDYEDFLISAAREAIETLSAREVIIELTEPDAQRIRSRLDTLAREGVTIEVRHPDSLDGGIRVFSGDQKRMVDNSFTARLNRMEENIRQEIWRTVIGTRIRQD